MYKTIVAVVAFLFIALAVQLYDQSRIQARIVRQQQEAAKVQSDLDERAANGHSKFSQTVETLVPDTFPVPGGPPKLFTITIDTSRMMDIAIAGHFAVSSKPGIPIEVYLFDEDDYTNWLYGNNATAIYASGRGLMGDVLARITKSGRYYLIFRNSEFPSSVDVTADIKMQYEKITS